MGRFKMRFPRSKLYDGPLATRESWTVEIERLKATYPEAERLGQLDKLFAQYEIIAAREKGLIAL